MEGEKKASPRRRPSSPRVVSPRQKDTVIINEHSKTLKTALSKAKESEACLLVVHGQPQGHRFFIKEKEMVIGRDVGVKIRLPDQSVSRKHATITKDEDSVKLTDLGSANGTFVNDAKVSKATVVLTKDSLIKVGNTLLKFLPEGEVDTLFYGSLGSAARIDGLTKVMNKAHFIQSLDAAVNSEIEFLSLIFLDLDLFKSINDTQGHDAGDYVLKEVCRVVMSNHVRKGDVFGRYGGEEFVIMLPGTTLDAAEEIAEKIRKSVESHTFEYEGKKLKVTVSIGVADLTNKVDTSTKLIKAADKALYAAKKSGRNKVCVAE